MWIINLDKIDTPMALILSQDYKSDKAFYHSLLLENPVKTTFEGISEYEIVKEISKSPRFINKVKMHDMFVFPANIEMFFGYNESWCISKDECKIFHIVMEF